ncbi:hypothetical protein ACA910_017268 [Epithemia clementina (nom. ined.)]
MSFRTAASRIAARGRASVLTIPRRNAQTVPRLGTEAEMKAEAVAQIRARIEYQKQLKKVQGHSHTEEVNEMWRWLNLTFYLAIPVSLASAFYSIFFDDHSHRIEGDLPEYMRIRTKEFPWECSDCDLLDTKCWKACRAEKGK